MPTKNEEDKDVVQEIPDEITDGMSSDEMWAVVRKRVDASSTIKELNDFLNVLEPDNRYIAIRDYVGRKKGDMIKSKRYIDDDDNKAEYQRYQDLKQEAEIRYKRDYSPAKLIDVDRACTNVYTILLRMIAEQQKQIDALNERVGITVEGITDDNITKEDVQGE